MSGPATHDRRLARCVMVLGTSSGAGKSYLTAALCRWYADQGLRVAPFKAQNMSNNARVVAGPGGEAGEIGAAQFFQARAARVEPDVRMNPVLLKPEADTRSQVVVWGRVRADLAAVPWRERSEALWPHARQALDELRAACDLVVIEGAGSPAEINLAASDFVNTRTALHAEAACLLVCDIDRGGAFAHCLGTHALMDERLRPLLRGFVLNKFRGDETLLAPGPELLQARTGVPTLAVLPMDRGHGLPEEDGLHDTAPLHAAGAHARTVAVLVPPHASNLDEFEPLRHLAGVRLVWTRDAAGLAQAGLVVLPGSKHTRADLAWLREQGLDHALAAHVRAGKPLLAVCGGLQMVGRTVADPLGTEGGVPGVSEGLGLLPLHTRFAAAKQLHRTASTFRPLQGFWRSLSGLRVEGYEIHAGQTDADGPNAGTALAALPAGLGWQQGPVLAVYLHGLFENPAVAEALFGSRPPDLDASLDRLAVRIGSRFPPGALMDLCK